MAQITNPQLSMDPQWRDQTVHVRVTCTVQFTPDEVAHMSKKPGRMYFSLYCSLYGHDADHPRLKRLDDELYTFASRILPSAEPSLLEDVTFSATLSQNLLDEDVVGADEIYARLELRGWIGFKGLFESAQTNLLSYVFA
jgi:hypothetical protein